MRPAGKFRRSRFGVELYAGRFFYQLYFQQPGVAEAEFEADLRTALRKIYYSGSGDAPKGLFRADKSPDARMLDDLPDPATLPGWLTVEDLDYYVSQFAGSGFRGPLNRYRNQERDWERLTGLNGARITPPACFIAGSRDGVLKFVPNADLVEYMKRWIDDLRVCALIEGAGHWIQQERPAEVTRLLLGFLATVSKT